MCMVCARGVHGMCMVCARGLHGMCMGLLNAHQRWAPRLARRRLGGHRGRLRLARFRPRGRCGHLLRAHHLRLRLRLCLLRYFDIMQRLPGHVKPCRRCRHRHVRPTRHGGLSHRFLGRRAHQRAGARLEDRHARHLAGVPHDAVVGGTAADAGRAVELPARARPLPKAVNVDAWALGRRVHALAALGVPLAPAATRRHHASVQGALVAACQRHRALRIVHQTRLLVADG